MVSFLGRLRNAFARRDSEIDPGPRRLKILFLGANAMDTSRLQIGAEFRDVLEEIERASRAIEVRAELAVTPVDLNRLLLEYEPDVVHFSGHGTVRVETPARAAPVREFLPTDEDFTEATMQSAILLETREGQAAPVSVEALARLFGILKTQRCVVLNACFSAAQAAVIAEHVDCVIGMKQSIDDRSAVVFAVGFYQAIARGQTVRAAFDLGCSLISTCSLPGADVPHLGGRVDPGSVRLVGAGASTATVDALQVSDVQVVPDKKSATCTLDFRVWNSGSVDILINRVSLQALEVLYPDPRSEARSFLESSKEYDLDIGSLQKPGDVVSCNVSQLVRPKGVDRFCIRLNSRFPGRRSWTLRPSLSTNLGRVGGPDATVLLPPGASMSNLRRMEEWREEWAARARHLSQTDVPKHSYLVVKPAGKRLRIFLGGETIVDTRRALVLNEDDRPPRYYVPREDVRAALRESQESGRSAKGFWHHLDVSAGGKTVADGAWCYFKPASNCQEIRDHVGFFLEKMDGFDGVK